MSSRPDIASRVGTSDKSLPWYLEEPDSVPDEARKLFEEYSHIPPEEVLPHIKRVRDRAWGIFPYPCVGQFGFLHLSIGVVRSYSEVVQRLKGGQKLLDIGCCFGQDIRKLVFDGAPSENIYGADLRMEYMDLGYELFRDKDTLESKFIAADIFDPESELEPLEGEMDMVHAAAFFHLFNWDDQVKAAKRMVALLKPQQGSTIIGRQVGNLDPGEVPKLGKDKEATMYRHDLASFERLWGQVGEETGTNWDVRGKLVESEKFNKIAKDWSPGTARLHFFQVTRL